MKKLKSKTIAITMILIMVIPIALFQLPSANAATYTSYPFIGAMPNPVGVGQQVLLHVGMLTALNNVVDGRLMAKQPYLTVRKLTQQVELV
jgi:hypothetical protein